MKKLHFITMFMASLALINFTGCKSTDKEPVVELPPAEEETEIQEDLVVPAPAEEEAPVDEEYLRSVGAMENAVSIETFNEDKQAILQKIKELDEIMRNRDFKGWTSHMDPASLTYWRKSLNLTKLAYAKGIKTDEMSNINDYFVNFFIGSREGHKIEEIRYISDSQIKAVEVNKDTDIVFYTFYKLGNDWKVHLPELTEQK